GVREVCTAFPDYHWELQALVVQEDTIAARLIGQGTHTGAFSGIAATGRRIRTQELVVYRLADGKIDQGWGDPVVVVRHARVPPPSATGRGRSPGPGSGRWPRSRTSTTARTGSSASPGSRTTGSRACSSTATTAATGWPRSPCAVRWR